MTIIINDKPFESQARQLSDVLEEYGATPPYAVALNGEFVAQHQYTGQAVQAGDRIEVVSPIFGG